MHLLLYTLTTDHYLLLGIKIWHNYRF